MEHEGPAKSWCAAGAPKAKSVQEMYTWADHVSYTGCWRHFWTRHKTCAKPPKNNFLSFLMSFWLLYFVSVSELYGLPNRRLGKFNCDLCGDTLFAFSCVGNFLFFFWQKGKFLQFNWWFTFLLSEIRMFRLISGLSLLNVKDAYFSYWSFAAMKTSPRCS